MILKPSGSLTLKTNGPSLLGSPSKIAIFAPGGSEDGPSTHLICSGRTISWLSSEAAVRKKAMKTAANIMNGSNVELGGITRVGPNADHGSHRLQRLDAYGSLFQTPNREAGCLRGPGQIALGMRITPHQLKAVIISIVGL